MTEDYVRSLGVIPGASPGSAGMLHDYITPQERLVACPNQDVVYEFGVIDAKRGPSVVQGLLTLTASATPPADQELRANWPAQPILDGGWTPPPVTRLG